jgi:hypothetical protein
MSRTRPSLHDAFIVLALLTFNLLKIFYCEMVVVQSTKNLKDKYIEGQLYHHDEFRQTNILGDHWVRVVDTMPLHKSYMLQVHHVCTDGGRNGLAVPQIGSALQALRSDQRYLPNSSYPAAFRTFTDEESLLVFSAASNLTRWVSKDNTEAIMC